MIFDPKKIDKTQFNLSVNIIRDHESSHHVCFNKLFPACRYKKDQLQDYKRFHVRVYIPKKALMNIKKEIERAIIMVNGLDETKYFTLYDQLGLKLAEHGIASVLIPLPGHLNRHAEYRNKVPVYEKRPTADLLANPAITRRFYFQFMEELDILLDHLTGQDCCERNDNCFFFRSLFGPETRVSILGYSIGALAALAHFIKRKDKYNSCFALNGGIQISDLRFPDKFIEKSVWKEFTLKLTSFWATQHKPTDSPDEIIDDTLFSQFFLGSYTGPLKEILKALSRRILFVFGGSDQLIPFQSLQKIEPEEHGLSILKIPGLGHFLPKEREWSNWIDTLVNLIANFEENAAHEILGFKELIETLIKLDRKHEFISRNPEFPFNGVFFGTNMALEKIEDANVYRLVQKLIQCSSAYISSEDLYSELSREKSKYLLGNLLVESGHVREDHVAECLLVQSKSGTALGELLVSKKYLDDGRLNKALRKQEAFYKEG